VAICVLLAAWTLPAQAGDSFSIASYNLENYVDPLETTRAVKSGPSKSKVREALLKLGADIVAIQEIGSPNALHELQKSLRDGGLIYPDTEFVSGPDTNIHVAILSRLPIVARRSHTNEAFLLHGRRFKVSRGIADVDIQVGPRFKVTLLAAHLKSRRQVPEADQSELREHEAGILRRLVAGYLDANPGANLVVLGDLNDVRNSRSTRLLIGHGAQALIDVRPAERNGDSVAGLSARLPPRNIAWTYYYATEDTYSRIDYILVSRSLAKRLDRNGTYVLAIPDWGLASDHRPIISQFSLNTEHRR
jgi:endonuclease/exonuclease/phosphatase family metal-dependent hydrolase